MVREANLDRRERMLWRIREEIHSAETLEPWMRAARELSDRLIISDGAFHYLAELFLDSVADEVVHTDAELVRIGEAIDAIAREHGLRDDETFAEEDAPAEWTERNAEWEARLDVILAELLRATGQSDVAQLLATNRVEFERRAEKGATEFWGEED